MDVAKTLANQLTKVVINPILALLFAAALLVFIYGLVEFLWGLNKEADSETRGNGKRHMLWGIVGMFVMLAAYSIIQLIANTVGTPIR